MKSKKISKKQTIGEVVQKYPETAEVFVRYGLHCFHCPMASMETLEQAASVHPDLDVKKLVKDLNKKIKNDS